MDVSILSLTRLLRTTRKRLQSLLFAACIANLARLWHAEAMDSLLDRLDALADDIPRERVHTHLSLWDERYRSAFEPEEMIAHIRAVDELRHDRKVKVLTRRGKSNAVKITVISHDRASLFAVITGTLGACGYSTDSGKVFTARRKKHKPSRGRRRLLPRRQKPEERVIIDSFHGSIADDEDDSGWLRRFVARIEEAVALLSTGRDVETLEARRLVNSWVAARLEKSERDWLGVLCPVHVDIDNSGDCTRLEVRSQDTPIFLYSFAIALSLRGIRIEGVSINTRGGEIFDQMDLLDAHSNRIEDEARLAELRFSVLLTKQFTYFLQDAPDAFAALGRFERLTEDIFRESGAGQHVWMERFGDPRALRDLARILGASDFIWEDFIRSQHEQLLPLLGMREKGTNVDFSMKALSDRLEQALAQSKDGWGEALNRWKDEEIFSVDLEHILNPTRDVRALAEPLSRVAEQVVGCAVSHVYDACVEKFGKPRTTAGQVTRMAVFGLGKLGGVALGYASDIELLFVYADSGRTDGRDPVDNSVFFEKLVREVRSVIKARREGVFQLDLRLRPYGQSGSLACSLDAFCRYYGPGGAALSYERLALVRLRAIAGDHALGARVQRLRDVFVYESRSVSVEEIQELRARQIGVKASAAKLNVKFSPGALVDLEYCVQLLQVIYGGANPELRTSRISYALQRLCDAGFLEAEESRSLTDAYYFLRRLINGLRMLRGNALDLFLPAADSLEFAHLARRMGYQRRQGLDVGRQLVVDFGRYTATIRRFVGRCFGREYLPDNASGNVVDILLDDHPGEERVATVLSRMGLKDPALGLRNLQSLASRERGGGLFSQLAILAGDMLQFVPAPDMALNNWERFVRELPDPGVHYGRLLLMPSRLEMMLSIFATSQFMADVLIRNPDFLEWVTDAHVVQVEHDVEGMLTGMQRFVGKAADGAEWLDRIRRFRRREILRIGTCDACLQLPVEGVTHELSVLAEAILRHVLQGVYESLSTQWRGRGRPVASLEGFVLLAFGKLGGGELNYSSDIDLVSFCDPERAEVDEQDAVEFYAKLVEQVRECLTRHTAEGYVYRVDFRLRPYGRSGPLVATRRAAQRYYKSVAALWEVQALLKARAVAGNIELGASILGTLRIAFDRFSDGAAIAEAVAHMRTSAIRVHVSDEAIDVKTGEGGIRDVEFLVQALQLFAMARGEAVWIGGTLPAIAHLSRLSLLSGTEAKQLSNDYAFLRRVEHFLQLLDDQQRHTLPKESAAHTALSRRAMGHAADSATFEETLFRVRRRVHALHKAILTRLREEPVIS